MRGPGQLPQRVRVGAQAHRGAQVGVGVQFQYRVAGRLGVVEWHDEAGQWWRSHGNENWEFDNDGYMARRFASINDLPIAESERKYRWPLGRRPDGHPGLTELGL